MIDSAYCQTMARYNQWMNQKLYAVCANIPDGDRKQDRGAFFKSIHGTLNHLLYADLAWLGRFTQQPFTASTSNDELYQDFDDLRQQRIATDQTMLSWAEHLSADWLAAPFTFTSAAYQQSRTAPTWVLVTHMFNHQTHHRGQLTTLLSQLGYEPGITDLPWLPDLN